MGAELFPQSDRHHPVPLAGKMTKYNTQHLTFNILKSQTTDHEDWKGLRRLTICACACACGWSEGFYLSLITVKYTIKVSRRDSRAAGSYSIHQFPCVCYSTVLTRHVCVILCVLVYVKGSIP